MKTVLPPGQTIPAFCLCAVCRRSCCAQCRFARRNGLELRWCCERRGFQRQKTGKPTAQAGINLRPEMAERSTATQCARGRTLGADKNYDTADSVTQCRARKITPHVVQNTLRTGGSAIDARTSRHAGYEISQFKRQMAERIHALPQTWSTIHRAMVRGLDRMNAHYQLALAGGNLARSVTLTAQFARR